MSGQSRKMTITITEETYKSLVDNAKKWSESFYKSKSDTHAFFKRRFHYKR